MAKTIRQILSENQRAIENMSNDEIAKNIGSQLTADKQVDALAALRMAVTNGEISKCDVDLSEFPTHPQPPEKIKLWVDRIRK